MCISDEGVKGAECANGGSVGSPPVAVRSGRGGPEVARAYRPRVPGLSSVGPRRPGTEHTVERPCDAWGLFVIHTNIERNDELTSDAQAHRQRTTFA